METTCLARPGVSRRHTPHNKDKRKTATGCTYNLTEETHSGCKEKEEEEEVEEEEVEPIHTQVSIPRFSNTTNLDILDSVRGYSRTEALPTSSRDLHSVRLVHLPAKGVIVNFV